MKKKRKLSKEETDLWKRTVAEDKKLATDKMFHADAFKRALEEFSSDPSTHNRRSEKTNAASPSVNDQKLTRQSGQKKQKKSVLQDHISLLAQKGIGNRHHLDVGPKGRRPANFSQARSHQDHQFERKEKRRLASGYLSIDSRLDLHGLRQNQAKSKLLNFLRRSQREGARYALVITGKGNSTRALSKDETSLLPDWQQSERPSGVLKAKVPEWLAEPLFQQFVVKWTWASIEHGGEGAMYIYIRAG